MHCTRTQLLLLMIAGLLLWELQFITMRVSFEIQGVFVNDKDKYDSLRHHIYANITPDKAWKEFLEKVVLVKVDAGNSKPKPETLFDMNTKKTIGH